MKRTRQQAYEIALKHYVKTGRVLPPEAEGTLRPYKEPLAPVASGYGFQGTLKQSVGKTHLQCHECGYYFANLATHVGKMHGLVPKAYKAKYELSVSTSLLSDKARANFIAANLKRSPEAKRKSLESFKTHRRTGGGNRVRKSLEAKNREGRCYYQLLDKINTLATKLKKVPTRREFVAEYGHGYVGSILGTFGSWSQAVTLAGLQPASRGGFRVAQYDRERVADLFKEFLTIEGRPPRLSDLGGGSMPSTKAVQRLFNGSIIEARRYAGMEEFDFIHERGEVEREVATS